MLLESNVVGVDHRFFSVGNNPDSFSPVGSTDACSWNNERLNFVSFAFQVSAHSLEDHAVLDVNNSSHILANNEPRFECFDNAKHLWPEMSVVTRSFLFARNRERLAGETSCDDIGRWNSICLESFFRDFFDIVIYFNSFPMFLQQQFAVFVYLAKSYRFIVSCSF
jgi:hypothetical protein